MSDSTPDDIIKYLNRLDYIPYIYENGNIELETTVGELNPDDRVSLSFSIIKLNPSFL